MHAGLSGQEMLVGDQMFDKIISEVYEKATWRIVSPTKQNNKEAIILVEWHLLIQGCVMDANAN